MRSIFAAVLLASCDGSSGVSSSDGAVLLVDASADVRTGDAATGGACGTAEDCAGQVCRQGDRDVPCSACVGGNCAVCDDGADCNAILTIWNACTSDHQCRECATTEDCASNPGAFGAICEPMMGLCVCKNNGDCVGNSNGLACLGAKGGYCGCASSADCLPGTGCSPIGGLDVCQPADGVVPDAGTDAAAGS